MEGGDSFPSARSPLTVAEAGHCAMTSGVVLDLQYQRTLLGRGTAASEAVTVPDDRAAGPALPDLFWAVLCHDIFARRGAAVCTDAHKAVFNPRSNDYILVGGSLKEVSLLSLQTDVETPAEGQTRALPPSWARWLIGRLSVVHTLTRTRKTRSILGRRRSSACHFF